MRRPFPSAAFDFTHQKVEDATATILIVWLADNKIWWDAPNSIRTPTAILVALALGIRLYGVYQSSKNTPKRSPRVRKIERVVAISLWSFVAVGVALLLLFKH